MVMYTYTLISDHKITFTDWSVKCQVMFAYMYYVTKQYRCPTWLDLMLQQTFNTITHIWPLTRKLFCAPAHVIKTQQGVHKITVPVHTWCIPFFARNNPLRSIFSMVTNQCCLPPFFITAIQHMENVTMFKGQPMRRTVIISSWIIII